MIELSFVFTLAFEAALKAAILLDTRTAPVAVNLFYGARQNSQLTYSGA